VIEWVIDMPPLLLAYFLGFAALAPFGYFASRSLDRLIRRLYEQSPVEWKAYGSPRGYFWKPPETLPASSLMAFLRAASTWPFRLPEPLRSDRQSSLDQRVLRFSLLVWNGGVLALFGFLAAKYGFPPRL
jgi:hypothetical protein